MSLASSYNKTLAERIGTRAHNFRAYITRYIGLIYKAKAGLDLSYGSLTTSVKLPYDYSSLAKSYSSLTITENLVLRAWIHLSIISSSIMRRDSEKSQLQNPSQQMSWKHRICLN